MPRPRYGNPFAAVSLRLEGESGIDPRQFIRRAIGNRAGIAGRALERIVVMHDDHAVARQVHVELEAVGAAGQAVVERDQRVLGPERGAAPVCVNQRLFRKSARCVS